MPPILAAAIYITGIVCLLAIYGGSKTKVSGAVWLPILWLAIAGSRHVSVWLGMAPTAAQGTEYLEGSPLDAAIYFLLIAAAIVVLMGRQRAVARIIKDNWPIVLFILYCALSVAWSDFPFIALKRWVKSLGDYSMVMILLTEADPKAAFKQTMTRVALVLFPLSILLIKYYPHLGRTYDHFTGLMLLDGVTSSKNMLGMDCLVLGFAAFWSMLLAWKGPRSGRNRSLFFYGLVVVLAVLLLYRSDSKTSLFCFLITIGLVTAHTYFKWARKPATLLAMVAVAILSCAIVLFSGLGSGVLKAIGRNPTLTGRTEIWHDLLQFPINPVVGTGFESFWLGKRLTLAATYPVLANLNESHDGYLEMYLNLGWVGLSLFAVLIVTGYRNIQQLLKTDPDAGRLRLGYFVTALVYNFTEAGTRSTDPLWIAFIFAIMTYPQRRLARTPASKTRQLPEESRPNEPELILS